MAGPILLGLMIAYFTDNPYNHTQSDVFLIASGIIFSQLAQVLLYYPYKFFTYIEAIKLRAALSALIYEKILWLTKYTMTDGVSGQAINLLSNDMMRYDLALANINDFWQHPVGGLFAGYLIINQIGAAAISGLVILILFMPFQAWLGKMSANVRLSTAKRTDKRVRVMLSLLNGIHVIKMYGWEHAFSKVVNAIRKLEIRAIARGYNIRATLLSFEILSKFAIFLSLVIYVVTGHEITARKAFIVIAYFDYIHRAVVFFWPEAITVVSEGIVSSNRIEEFLLLNINKQKPIFGEAENDNPKKETGVVLRDATAHWNQEYNTVGIHKVNLSAEGRRFTAIIGQVGSGKTSLLEVILKELPLVSGELYVTGVVSYAPQQSWVFEESVRNNIIFTEKFDEERYRMVTHVCSLERDFELMPHGDQTIVGARGASLSGGQRARINLARTVYKEADIYLLDDPLSAVDPHVSKNLFEECIKGFLRDKTVILVTHQLQYMSQADHIVVMNQGQVQMQGTYDEVRVADAEFKKIMENYKEKVTDVKKLEKRKSKAEAKKEKIHLKQKIEKETQQLGKIHSTVYRDYFKAVNSNLFIICVAILFVVTQFTDSCLSIFISVWLHWEDNKNSRLQNLTTSTSDDTWTTEKHIQVYTVLIILLAIVATLRAFAFYRMCLRLAKNFHDLMFRGVTRSFMYFFHKNPTGRILNRFSKDIGTLDSTLPLVVIDCIKLILEFSGVTAIVVSTNFWLIVPTFAMCVVFYVLRFIFLTTARNVKRVEAISE